MSVTPANALSLPLQNLRTTLANASAFQTWVGAADAAAALKRIRYFGLDHPQAWTARTAVAKGEAMQFVLPSESACPGGAFLLELTTEGTTGDAEPCGGTAPVDGATITDGTAVWTARALLPDKDRWNAALQTALVRARPFALVAFANRYEARLAAYQSWQGEGDLIVYLEGAVAATDLSKASDPMLTWANAVGAIMDGLRAQSNVAGALNLISVRLTGFRRAEVSELNVAGDYVSAEITVGWRGMP